MTPEILKHTLEAHLRYLNGEGERHRANLQGANLRGAFLLHANLQHANLQHATLRGADLEGATLQDANLQHANLQDANLQHADLQGANLWGADLEGANLRYANLGGADLKGANLQGVISSLGLTRDATLPGRILAQLEAHPESWQQAVWHDDCGTAHCVAGWATTLSGPLGAYMDATLGTATAATLLLWHPGCVLPSFAGDADEAECLERLRVLAQRGQEEAL